MIFVIFATLTITVFSVLVGLLPSIPPVPIGMDQTINTTLDFIFNHLQLITVFIRPQTFVLCGTALIVILNFEVIYRFITFLICKIPFLKNWG